jgi:hypothetical protein
MLVNQNYFCAACPDKLNFDISRGIHIDHDHNCCPGNRSCGKCVRGVVCMACNIAIGWCKDDADKGIGISTYLLRYSNVTHKIMLINGYEVVIQPNPNGYVSKSPRPALQIQPDEGSNASRT